MVTTARVKQEQAQAENGQQKPHNGSRRSKGDWPEDILEAYRRDRGPYTPQNALTLIEEEPLELYNGWLVWQEMTDIEERRIASNLQFILDATARSYKFGQAYPDQFECLMTNGDVHKPDLCVVSKQKYKTDVIQILPTSEHLTLKGGPKLVIENRSPSNRRTQERKKRKAYFDSGTLVIWDVDPKKRKIWVYEAENPSQGLEYGEGDVISCEVLFPGWQRPVADFFGEELTTEQMVGQPAVEWRAESRAEGLAEGRAEGELMTLKQMLLRNARLRFGAEKLPPDFEERLNRYNTEQLTSLSDALFAVTSLKKWLAKFPE